MTLERVQGLTSGIGTEDLVNTIQAGNDRRTGATVFRFFPASPTFRVGAAVELRMPASTSEAHTFTFGPTNGKNLYNDQLAAVFFGPVLDPRGVYPSEPAAAVPALTAANHGNGFYNSGLLDGDAASPLTGDLLVTYDPGRGRRRPRVQGTRRPDASLPARPALRA